MQIWEVAHWNFEKHIDKIRKNPKGGPPIPFSDVVDGSSVAFEIIKSGTWKDREGKEHDSTDYVGHRFVPREEEIPDDWGDKIFSLDACVNWKPTYEEQMKAFPLSNEIGLAPIAPTEDKQTDDVPIDDEPPPEEPKETGTVKDVEAESKKFQDRANKSKEVELECPGGGTIGVDLEKLKECPKCAIWDDCADTADRLKAEEKAAAKKEVKKEKPPEEKPPEKKKILRRRRKLG
jgi:hypothetical protein